MAVRFRDVASQDLDSVLALNNAAGPTILPLSAAALRDLYEQACYFRVAEVDGHVAGFLVALNQDADYTSPNFRWFAERYPRFVYIDRIVVARGQRGLGLGRVFYADVTSYAEVRVPVLTCEVFLEPRDDVSVLFHGTYGFHEVGQQVMPGLERRVSLLAKDLPSYRYVQDTYLQGPAAHLPALPWLADRVRRAPGGPRRAATGS